jgi:hypothetical protein
MKNTMLKTDKWIKRVMELEKKLSDLSLRYSDLINENQALMAENNKLFEASIAASDKLLPKSIDANQHTSEDLFEVWKDMGLTYDSTHFTLEHAKHCAQMFFDQGVGIKLPSGDWYSWPELDRVAGTGS